MDVPDLEAGLVAYATERCGAAAVEIRWLGVERAVLDEPGRASWDGDPCRAHPTLSLWWTAPAGVTRYTVRPELVIWVEAPVAAAPARAGEPVTGELALVELSALVGGRFTGGAAVARRALRAGDPLTSLTVAPAPDAASGARVTLRARVGDLEIRGEGKLLENARIGESVRVWVAATDVSVRGVLSSPDLVDL